MGPSNYPFITSRSQWVRKKRLHSKKGKGNRKAEPKNQTKNPMASDFCTVNIYRRHEFILSLMLAHAYAHMVCKDSDSSCKFNRMVQSSYSDDQMNATSINAHMRLGVSHNNFKERLLGFRVDTAISHDSCMDPSPSQATWNISHNHIITQRRELAHMKCIGPKTTVLGTLRCRLTWIWSRDTFLWLRSGSAFRVLKSPLLKLTFSMTCTF